MMGGWRGKDGRSGQGVTLDWTGPRETRGDRLQNIDHRSQVTGDFCSVDQLFQNF